MKPLQALLLVLCLGFAAAQAQAEVRDPSLSMLGPLLGLSADTLSVDTSRGIEHIHLAAVLNGEVISTHDRLLTVHGDRAASAAVTVAAYASQQPGCPLQVLLGTAVADNNGHTFQHGHGITCLPDAEVTRRMIGTSTPDSLLPGPTRLDLPLDQWLTVSAARFGDAVPTQENPADGLIVFHMYLSTDADSPPSVIPGTATF